MSDWVAFEGAVGPVVFGKATDTVLRLPAEAVDALGAAKRVEVRLRPAPDDRVDLPEDAAGALRAADMTSVWEGLTAGKRRGMLYQIGTARTAATRAKRIDAMIQSLK